MKIKRIASVLLLTLLPLTVLLTVQCRYEASEARNAAPRSVAGGFVENKIYSKATVKEEFVDNKVAVVLNRSASRDFRKYTSKDFPEVRCTQVMDATDLTMEVVKQQLEAEKTGDWSKLQERVKTGMLVDIEKFRRILYLDLPEKSKENVLEVVKLLEKREDILYTGPVYFIEPCAVPNPLPTRYNSYQKSVFDSIFMEQAWDMVTDASGIRVGVLDSGIQANHPALVGRVNAGLSRDFTDPNFPGGKVGGTTDPYFPDGHGTGVAGIIAGNKTYIVGVCWDVNLVSLQVFDSNLQGNASHVAKAITYATDNNIPILNFSGKAIINSPNEYNDLRAAIEAYPGFFVAAAGKENVNIDAVPVYPASWSENIDQLIVVGALDASGNSPLAGSNTGPISVDLFAPGYNVYTTNNMSAYMYMQGTSAAAPFVSGVAALLMTLDPTLTGAQLKDILRNNVTPAGLSAYCNTGGKLNAFKVVDTYTKIVGSIDINFYSTGGTVGKFYLYKDGTWAITDTGVSVYPIQYYPPSNPGYVGMGSVPSAISTRMNDHNIGVIGGSFRFQVPAYIPQVSTAVYLDVLFNFGVYASSTYVSYGNSFSTLGPVSSTMLIKPYGNGGPLW